MLLGFIIIMLRGCLGYPRRYHTTGKVDYDGDCILKLPDNGVPGWANIDRQYFVEHESTCNFHCNGDAVE